MITTVRHVTVESYERVLERRDGQILRVLEPGRHRRVRRARYDTFDLRERQLAVAPQQIVTTDGLLIKVSAVALWAIGDVSIFADRAVQPIEAVYLAIQVSLRDQLAALTVEEALGARIGELAETATAAAGAAGASVGVAVRQVVIKDVVGPSEVRAAAVDLVTARQRGQARLEEARAETAALRSLANAAKLLDDHPALARLRMIQAAPYGSQLTISVPSD